MSFLRPQDAAAQPLERTSRWLTAVMAVAAGLIVICFGVRLTVSWRNYGDLANEGGIWTTLALDANDGVLYRPLVSDLGYGGTRYGPLHVLLHAGLIRAGIPPVTGGFLIGVATAAAAMAGLFTLLRRLEVPASLAVLILCFFLAAVCVRSGILSIKADLLAAALDVWGLVAVVSAADRPTARFSPAIPLAAVCFALAAMSKVTSIFGIVAATLWFLTRREKKRAVWLAAIYILCVLLAVLAVQWASQGRAIAIFRACGSAGGGLHRLTKAPPLFFQRIFLNDKAVGGFWTVAILLLLARRKWTDLTTILLIVTSLGTLAIFGSPGTDINHLIDLQMASLLLVAVQFRSGRMARVVVPLVASVMVIHAAASSLGDVKRMLAEHRRRELDAALLDAGNSRVRGPLLTENPVLPILAGNRPYMLDYVMFGVLDLKDPRFGQKLRDDLANQRFRAVIIGPWLTQNAEPRAFNPWPEILERMKERYELRAVEYRTAIYLPKPR
ncbi:MAG: hypothetical protein ABSB74_03110 [Tepidisphaeraceae bacterium]